MYKFKITFTLADKTEIEYMQSHAESLLDHHSGESPFEIISQENSFLIASDDLEMLGKLLLSLNSRMEISNA